MAIAQKDLDLETVFLLYPGEMRFQLREGMEAIGLVRLEELEFGN